MTDKLREAAQQAADALDACVTDEGPEQHELTAAREALKNLRAALAPQKPLFAEMIAQHPGLAAELAQQDAQKPECNHKFVVDAASSISVCTHCGSPERSKKRDEWGQYLKDGETPFDRFMRERKDLDALMTLYQSALQENERLKTQQDAQAVLRQQDVKILIVRLENQAHRAGELWERCQGKSWPEKESAEFAALRDVKMPQTRAALAARLNAAPTPPAQRVMLTDDEIEETMRDYVDVENGLFKVHKALIEAYERKNGLRI